MKQTAKDRRRRAALQHKKLRQLMEDSRAHNERVHGSRDRLDWNCADCVTYTARLLAISMGDGAA